MRIFQYFPGELAEDLIKAGVTTVVFYVVSWLMVRELKKKKRLTPRFLESTWSFDFAVIIRETKNWFLLFISLYFGSHFLELRPNWERFIDKSATIVVILQCFLWVGEIIKDQLRVYVERNQKTYPAAPTVASLLKIVLRVLLGSMFTLLLLDQVGVNVTTLVAGLGVGGIAVALAVQNILGDLLASLTIILDKPFVPGDLIKVDDFTGTVRRIGLKTTRVESVDGEQIIFSNSDLLKGRLRNFRQMNRRRVLFRLNLSYETPVEFLEALPGKMQAIVESLENTRFDRCHFVEYGDFSLKFETVYQILNNDMLTYLDAHEKVLLLIGQEFRAHKIEFAYPTNISITRVEADWPNHAGIPNVPTIGPNPEQG